MSICHISTPSCFSLLLTTSPGRLLTLCSQYRISPPSPVYKHTQSLSHRTESPTPLQGKKKCHPSVSDSAGPSFLPFNPKPHLNSGVAFFPVLGSGMNSKIQSVMKNPIDGMPSAPAVGYRFRPTDEELVSNYLKPKLLGDDLEDLLIIAEIKVCNHEPWDLPVKSEIKSDDAVWYFFCPRDLKYSNSRRSNRRTKAGFWKPTGKTIKVKSRRNKEVIGTKKTLVFYRSASPKAERTAWIIHEYEVAVSDSSFSNLGEYVLCKLKKKLDGKTGKGVSISGFEAEPSCSMAFDFENHNRSELTANSACVESESSNHLASDFENPNSNELPTNLAQEVSELSCFSTTNNQNLNELMSNLAYDGSGLHHSMATNFGNPNSNELISSSSYDGSGSLHSMASNYEIQYRNELISNSAYDGSGGLLHSMTSNYEIQYLNERIFNSAYNGSEQSHSMASDSENQNLMDTTFVFPGYSLSKPPEQQVPSPSENWFTTSDFEDPLSPLQPEGETGPSMEMPFQFTNCLLASDFENQNIDKETDISALDEGKRSSPTVMPLDLENENPWGKIDMPTLEGGGLCCLMASPGNSPADASFLQFLQLSPRQLELEAFLELGDILNSPPQPPASTITEEVPNYTGSGSVSY
ncbi:PREDICTED: NAC domain-containing protein 69-like [Populus euphratica]|uniref:NAC domain-containing protein 69-like n=1 Tax=Populus euphratica TaxID=75702 RepID=A0AAJ6U8N0_POPEU|nr:PREDICTED: NAC domain-containing protein 69-like [Populus euphratica]